MTKKHVFGSILGIVLLTLVFVGVRSLVTDRVDNALLKANLALTARIAEQELLLNTIADLTAQSGADAITERIIVDCSNQDRQHFDELLNLLSKNISGTELHQLDLLFNKCGHFFADRKSVMAARLVREVEVYRGYIELKTSVLATSSDVLLSKAAEWKQLADNELKLATDFNKLVDLQGDIILTLLAGKDRNSPEITTTLEAVTSTRNNMTILSKQIENLRSELRPL